MNEKVLGVLSSVSLL